MTTKTPIKSLPHPGEFITIAEVSRRIQADHSLPLTLRKDMASSLNTLAKASGQLLEAIEANPPSIRDLIRRKTAAMVGVSTGRWNNVRSHVCFAMLHLGVITIPNRIDDPPSEAWATLLARLTEKGPIAVLGRFARCCTRIGVAPGQVDDAFMEGYREDLFNRSLISEPATNFRETVLAWNAAAANIAGWPATCLTVPDDSLYYTPNWSTYPPSLIADIEVWLDGRSAGGKLFERLAPRRARRAKTVKSHRDHLRLMLGGMVLSGENPELLVDLAAVVTPERVHKSCTFHLARADDERSHVNARIASLAVAIATHHLKMVGPELARLKAIAKELRMPKRGMTERNKARLRAMDDPGRLEALLLLPIRMAAEVDKAVKQTGESTPSLALKYQTALAIELALFKSWRISNLGSLTIGQTLLLRPDGRAVAAFDNSQVKNRQEIETALSKRAGGMLNTYLAVHRPLLADRPSNFLFPGKGTGRAKTLGALNENIKTVLRERVGIDATTHFFRHLAGKLILDNDPRAIRMVQLHLGHDSLASTLGFYVDSRGAEATAVYDEMIESKRAATSGRPVPGSKKGRK